MLQSIAALNKLAKWLRSEGHRKAYVDILYFIKTSQWKDGVPSFNWLNNGIIGKLKSEDPEAFDEFIELNSDRFATWDPVKYLGSGLVGDAWLLADDKILKIFDAGATVYQMTDSEKYEDIMDAQYDGSADPNIPMIYDHGMLESPSGFYNTKSPSQKNIGGYYIPGYVIMERLDTPADKAKQYMDYNPYLLEPGFVFEEDADDWTEREYPEGEEVPPISVDEIPEDLHDRYLESITEGTYDEFVQYFVEHVFNYIIMDMQSVIEIREEDHGEDYFDDNEEGDEIGREELPAFNDPSNLKAIADDMANALDYSEFYTEESVEALERILNLPKGWEKQLSTSIINNYMRGRKDLHAGNFGFRGNKVVFFDA